MASDRALLTLRQRGVLSLPRSWRTSELFEAVRREDGVIELRPQSTVTADQAWFWTQRWQQMEREAQADINAGRVTLYDSAQDMFADLDRFRAKHARLSAKRQRR